MFSPGTLVFSYYGAIPLIGLSIGLYSGTKYQRDCLGPKRAYSCYLSLVNSANRNTICIHSKLTSRQYSPLIREDTISKICFSHQFLIPIYCVARLVLLNVPLFRYLFAWFLPGLFETNGFTHN